MNPVIRGALAGAVGTLALDVTTFADMALRGRAPSHMTQLLTQRLAARAGYAPLASSDPDEATAHRQVAVGTLMGYVVGIGAGVVYGVVRERVGRRIPVAIGSVALGLAVMATTDGMAILVGATDPTVWTRADWLADLTPHLVYGLKTAAVYEMLAGIE